MFQTKHTNDSSGGADTDWYTVRAVNGHGQDGAPLQICVICEYRGWGRGDEKECKLKE